jgi:hypothetical protein
MHHKGHIRDTFLRALDAFYCWDEGEPEPTVEHEIHYEPIQITLTEACKLVWRCTDTLPSTWCNLVKDTVIADDVKSQSYAAVAQALYAYLKRPPASQSAVPEPPAPPVRRLRLVQ